MGTLKLNTTSGGSVSIQAADGASDNTVTLPAVSGANIITSADSGTVTQGMIGSGVAGSGPAFSAYMTGTQSFNTSTLTKVTYNTEAFDTASCYDTSNYRFTPNVAGYYWIKSVIVFSGSSGICNLWLYRNGGQNKIGGQIPLNSNAVSVNFSELVYLNGSTDYVEMYASQNSGSTASNLNLGSYATFQGYLVRAS